MLQPGFLRISLIALCIVPLLAACDPRPPATAPLFDDLGQHRHPVTVANEKAQQYFDQGLRLSFAFNHAEALLQGDKAAEAEAVYRADLKHNRRNGWSLFGLEQSLRSQGKTAAADEVKRRFEAAWTAADVKLAASRF